MVWLLMSISHYLVCGLNGLSCGHSYQHNILMFLLLIYSLFVVKFSRVAHAQAHPCKLENVPLVQVVS